MGSVRDFLVKNYKHFNARETVDAAQAYEDLLGKGGKMMITLAGAMSTGEIGITLAEMIRQGKVHAITCTAANLEEDLFNLFNHNEYKMVPEYRDLSPEDETRLYDAGFNRVTDTCIPETVMIRVEHILEELWAEAAENGERRFPCEWFFAMLDQPGIEEEFQIDPAHSWMLAAKEAGIPVFSPGWEDSTMGNKFAALVMRGKVKNHLCIKTGTEQMQWLSEWYLEQAKAGVRVGFFQIGGGIAGDFPICVVPMLIQDMKFEETPFWAYFCQISDAVTSYGGYSGAVPNEKITWGKLDAATPKFMIQSDASIVAPLVFAYLLDY